MSFKVKTNTYVQLKRLVEGHGILITRVVDTDGDKTFTRYRFSNKDGLGIISQNRHSEITEEDIKMVVSIIEDFYVESKLNNIEAMRSWLINNSVEEKDNGNEKRSLF